MTIIDGNVFEINCNYHRIKTQILPIIVHHCFKVIEGAIFLSYTDKTFPFFLVNKTMENNGCTLYKFPLNILKVSLSRKCLFEKLFLLNINTANNNLLS